MRRLFFVVPLLIFSGRIAFSEEIQIFDMRKSLALADDEKVYRDFYISQGFKAGLRPGMIVTVKRRTPLYDAIHNRSAGELNVPVARVKIVHVESNLAVARQHSEFGRHDLPLLEDNFIMIGDIVDLSSATTEGKIKSAKGEGAEANPTPASAPQEAAVSAHNRVDFVSEAPHNPTAAPEVSGLIVQ